MSIYIVHEPAVTTLIFLVGRINLTDISTLFSSYINLCDLFLVIVLALHCVVKVLLMSDISANINYLGFLVSLELFLHLVNLVFIVASTKR